MIVRIMSKGKSFKGLAAYLTHDPDADSAERVAWTHTLNLAHDHVPSAVDEMVWTARDAELLKQEAGIRAGGRATRNPVKHISLNWSPEEQPTREHMIEAADEFLAAMKWREHQAILVAHDDKSHQHVHIMLNVVHPETGLRLNDDFERRRVQAWALAYEREQGRIFCEQRLLDPGEREDAPTREAWMAFEESRKIHEGEEKARREKADGIEKSDEPKLAIFDEWKRLKDMQKSERLDFFAEGKTAFSELRREIYGEIRAEFRDRWANYYAACGASDEVEALAIVKADLIKEQREALKERRDEAFAELRAERKDAYRDLLDDQHEQRQGLRTRQEAGFDNGLFLDLAALRRTGHSEDVFRENAAEVTGENREQRDSDFDITMPRERENRMKPAANIGANLTTGVGFGLISFLESLADGFVGAKPDPKRRPEPEPDGRTPFDTAASEAGERYRRAREQEDEEWRKRQRFLSGD